MDLPNRTEAIDVSSVDGIAEAIAVEWSSRSFDGEPLGKPTHSFDLGTHGALKITMENGDVLVIGTSEWATVDFYNADSA